MLTFVWSSRTQWDPFMDPNLNNLWFIHICRIVLKKKKKCWSSNCDSVWRPSSEAILKHYGMEEDSTVYSESYMREAPMEHLVNGVATGGLQITYLIYADEIVLLAKTSEKLQVMNIVYTACSKYKLGINKQRSKSINIGREREAWNISINGERLEQVICFKYLGV